MYDVNFNHRAVDNVVNYEENLNEAGLQFTYGQCIKQIKNVYTAENDENNHDSYKHNVIGQILRKYYKSEEKFDLFEGFLHLLVYVHKLGSEKNAFDNTKLSIQVLNNFYEYVDKLELDEQDTILNTMPEDKENFVCRYI